MYLQDITGRKAERIRGMVEITAAVRALIDFQNQQSGELPAEEYESELQEHIRRLNTVYDRFVKEYGWLNSYGNVIAFSRDSNAPLLRSIEKESKVQRKEPHAQYRRSGQGSSMPCAGMYADGKPLLCGRTRKTDRPLRQLLQQNNPVYNEGKYPAD